MNKENTKYLVENYKEFFEYLKDHKGPIIPIQFGFECGDGWFMLLDELMGDIQNHIENENSNRKYRFRHKLPLWLQRQVNWRIPYKRKYLKKFLWWVANRFPRGVAPMPPIQITQIKEKFGGLRFYINGGDDYIYGMIALAESLSYKICESCGTTINVGQTQGWIYTCCKDCYDKNERAQRLKWTPQVTNINKEAQKNINKLVDEHEQKGKKSA